MRVKAKAKGYFQNQIKNEGAVFKCSEREFSPTWMSAIGGNGEVLKDQPKKLKTEKMKESFPVLTEEDVKGKQAEEVQTSEENSGLQQSGQDDSNPLTDSVENNVHQLNDAGPSDLI